MTPGERVTIGWVPDDNTVGARLILIRQRKGWTNLSYAAKACDVAPETWRAWENNTNKNPRNYEAIVAKIARKSGCDAGWLYAGPELTGKIDLDKLEDTLRRGLSGPTALALALRPGTDVGSLQDTGGYQNNADRSSTNQTTDYIGRRLDEVTRPGGRPQTSQTSLTGPKPVRPAKLRGTTTRQG